MGWLAKDGSPTPLGMDEPCAVARHAQHVQGLGAAANVWISSLAGRTFTRVSNNLKRYMTRIQDDTIEPDTAIQGNRYNRIHVKSERYMEEY